MNPVTVKASVVDGEQAPSENSTCLRLDELDAEVRGGILCRLAVGGAPCNFWVLQLLAVVGAEALNPTLVL